MQVPHLTLGEEVIFDNLKRLRTELRPSFEQKGLKLSYMPLIIKATSMSLLQFPMLNASLNVDATELTYHASHNIGVAMDTPKGLIVPVIKNVQDKSITEIAKELADLQVRFSSINSKIYLSSNNHRSQRPLEQLPSSTYLVERFLCPTLVCLFSLFAVLQIAHNKFQVALGELTPFQLLSSLKW